MDRLRNFGFLIKDIGRLYTRLFEQRASHLGMTLAQCKALAYISRNESISQIRLAELTGIEPMSLVRILDRMEADGWIERRMHPTDRRARQLHLTARAQPTLDQMWQLSDAVRMQTLAGFKAQERDLLIELLARAHANLLDAKLDEQPKSTTAARQSEAAKPDKATLRRASLLSASQRAKSVSVKRSKLQRAVR
jgi:DNA-binding MarR family transcriptional regulator